jgi:hypothetical protein
VVRNYSSVTRAGEISLKTKNSSLFQNYPNPFRGKTTIRISNSCDGPVTLKVFNSIGSELVTLSDQWLPKGEYSFLFDGSNFPDGVYYYSLHAGASSETKKMIQFINK